MRSTEYSIAVPFILTSWYRERGKYLIIYNRSILYYKNYIYYIIM